MYFIDRNKIYASLTYMDQLLDLFRQETGWQKDQVHALALERLSHGIVESIIDVGNSMIDGFIMRDPGSYEDIIDILEDEKVITSQMADPLKRVVELRKMIVRDFVKVDIETLDDVLNGSLSELAAFPQKVRDYLENELGPVSAFLPSEQE
ncbi:DUF86 domain-containing protein [Sporosarcina sp. Te-1]|uniref:DUF86 domain-containing protein n=1 Tax=Sporosarcina sp. Te-1 TaxID=2818390 RepID=UPI001A9D4AE3|nr:DUF86 domain-containing protein [Sporosarcina sp. Te-1]QTD42711.1 DUF86 domain-containing protein [Sporosarcina sp. Te-1]